jgi:hypothetical protein
LACSKSFIMWFLQIKQKNKTKKALSATRRPAPCMGASPH